MTIITISTLSRLLLYALFFSVALPETRRQWKSRPSLGITLSAFAFLAAGELAALILELLKLADPAGYPIRNFFEIGAVLTAAFACNFETLRLNKKYLRLSVVHNAIALLVPVVVYVLFPHKIGVFIVYGLEIIYIARYLIIAMEKTAQGFLRREVVFAALAFLFFFLDIFVRFFDNYIPLFMNLAVAFFCAPYLSFALRDYKQAVTKTIATRDREIQIFADITKKLNSTFKLEALLESFVREICEILDAYSSALYIDRKVIKSGRSSADEKRSGELVCEAVHGFYPPVDTVNERAITKLEFLHKIIKSAPVQSGDGVVGRVFETGKAERLMNLDTDPAFVQTIPKVAVTKTIITLPLSRQGIAYGVLQVVNRNDGDNFQENDFRFAEMIVDQASLAIYNTFLLQERERKLETDMDLKAAQEIQLSLIPKDIPATKTLDIAMHFSPTKQIGGDYYDFIRIDDTHLGVIIADVSGKGVTGGLVMSVMRTIVRMIAENNYSPRAVLTELNHGVAIAVKEKHMFITVMYCIFDEAGKTVKVCRAGHNPFLVCKGATGEIQMLKPEGIALGIIDSATFSKLTKEIEVPYQSGDSFYLYTDGVVEEFDKNRQMFGEERLKTYIAKTKDDPSAPVIDGIVKALNKFRGEDQEQHDDTAMIRIRAL